MMFRPLLGAERMFSEPSSVVILAYMPDPPLEGGAAVGAIVGIPGVGVGAIVGAIVGVCRLETGVRNLVMA